MSGNISRRLAVLVAARLLFAAVPAGSVERTSGEQLAPALRAKAVLIATSDAVGRGLARRDQVRFAGLGDTPQVSGVVVVDLTWPSPARIPPGSFFTNDLGGHRVRVAGAYDNVTGGRFTVDLRKSRVTRLKPGPLAIYRAPRTAYNLWSWLVASALGVGLAGVGLWRRLTRPRDAPRLLLVTIALIGVVLAAIGSVFATQRYTATDSWQHESALAQVVHECSEEDGEVVAAGEALPDARRQCMGEMGWRMSLSAVLFAAGAGGVATAIAVWRRDKGFARMRASRH